MQWVASTLHTTSEHRVSSITTADAHKSADSSRLNWRPPADLNGLVLFADRRNLFPARVPSHFKRSLPLGTWPDDTHRKGGTFGFPLQIHGPYATAWCTTFSANCHKSLPVVSHYLENFNSRWTTSLSHVMHICEPKEHISNAFFNLKVDLSRYRPRVARGVPRS